MWRQVKNSDMSGQETLQEAPGDILFDFLSDSDGKLSLKRFRTFLAETGLRENDPRLTKSMDNFKNLETEAELQQELGTIMLTKTLFSECVSENIELIMKAFRSELIIPEFTDFRKDINDLYQLCKSNNNGSVATHKPQLARFDPEKWGVAVCTVDGQRHSIGDTQDAFCLQSISKPLMYALVMSEYGAKYVHEYVGHEPSGRSFSEISLNHRHKPHNPMLNTGAIVTTSLLKPDLNIADRFDFCTQRFKRFAGGEYLGFNNSVFLSEKETADKNFALAYYMKDNKCFPPNIKLTEVLDFYFQQCSIEVTCDSLSVIAATLANGGVCPVTYDKMVSSEAVRSTLSLMHSCGMYDYSGEFAFTVGLPAKSGMSGGVMLVIPKVMGIAMWSPPLDQWGNSCRGLQFCQEFVERFGFHQYEDTRHSISPTKKDPRLFKMEPKEHYIVNLLYSASKGDLSAVRRYALLGLDMELGDYDGRTSLHVAAAEGHDNVVKFLLEKCNVSPRLEDRWGQTPLEDARRFEHDTVVAILEKYM